MTLISKKGVGEILWESRYTFLIWNGTREQRIKKRWLGPYMVREIYNA